MVCRFWKWWCSIGSLANCESTRGDIGSMMIHGQDAGAALLDARCSLAIQQLERAAETNQEYWPRTGGKLRAISGYHSMKPARIEDYFWIELMTIKNGGTLTTKIVVVCDSNLVVSSSVDKSGESFQTTSGRNVAGKMVNVRRVIPRAGRTFQHARGKGADEREMVGGTGELWSFIIQKLGDEGGMFTLRWFKSTLA